MKSWGHLQNHAVHSLAELDPENKGSWGNSIQKINAAGMLAASMKLRHVNW